MHSTLEMCITFQVAYFRCYIMKKIALKLFRVAFFYTIGATFKQGKCFVCLLILGFSSLLRIFHSNGDATIAGERLQTLTYARHSLTIS